MSKKPFDVLRGILVILQMIFGLVVTVGFVVLLNLADAAFTWFKWVLWFVLIVIITSALAVAFIMGGSPDANEDSEEEKTDGQKLP